MATASALLTVRLALWLLPFGCACRTLDRLARAGTAAAGGREKAAGVPARGASDVQRIARSVTSVARRLPGAGGCLVQALAAKVLMERHGVPVVLRIGVARGQNSRLRAHAWLEHDGLMVLGGQDAEHFTPLPLAPGRFP